MINPFEREQIKVCMYPDVGSIKLYEEKQIKFYLLYDVWAQRALGN